MALKPCRECDKAVSTDARACPYCGATGPTQTDAEVATGKAFRTILVVVSILGFLLWATVNGWFG